MVESANNYTPELDRRYRLAATTSHALVLAVVALMAVAYFAGAALYRGGEGWTIGALRIAILVFALGAIVIRRTRYNAIRLQDIAALKGMSGLLATLQNTSIQIALMAIAIALMGFIGTILSGSYSEMLRAGVISLVLLAHGYPRKSSWQRVARGITTFGDANAAG
jgi:hypothetical protein